MRKLYFIVASIIFAIANITNVFNSNAQAEVFMGDVAGNAPLTSTRYINVQGSSYFGNKEQWFDGVVKLSDGKIYGDVSLMYDQVLDCVYFKSLAGKPLAFKLNVLEFKLKNTLDNTTYYFVKGFSAIDGSTENSYYQKLNYLEKTSSQFLKRSIKKIYESRVYNSAVTDRSIENIDLYYLVLDGKMVKVKLEKKSFLKILNNKPEIAKYISDQKYDMKTEAQAIKLLSYYDFLK